ncbi:MAG TPA: thioredoxin domain-containing protein [Micromonosporaceae bacterium]|nr:thioredoxin domain-containing protein [Micromonosporaceae bacterium]
MNRLADAMSPYLRQHADNPVDWWRWGPDAFAEARRRDVPLLISVGYAACHWCHVMAHESFEDDEVARLLNQHTVPVKVDREERPDVDAVYMAATQAMTGQGGWPMTVFATPDGEPFFCGTYFPKPNFVRLVTAISQAWREQRDAVLRQGQAVTAALEELRPAAAATPLSADLLDAAAATLHSEHDSVNGGFGAAPKFPPGMCLEFLLRHHARTGSERSLEVVRHTCERMARGGVYDQLAGGFARYSVDSGWVVPHFEKMLYDNALLLRVYTHLWRATGDPLTRRVAEETAGFLLRDLATPEGGFASALDADTDGAEGATYVWTPAQLRRALGEVDGVWAANLLGVTPEGSFEHGASVLQLRVDPEDPARWARLRDRLRAVRDARPQPARDDKVVAAWNGLAITALAEFSQVLPGQPDASGAALRAANLLADLHLDDGRLRRISRDGRVGEAAGVLEDYGAVAEAFCAAHQLTADGRWLRLAGELLDTAQRRFAAADGGFYDTADDAERLVTRPADPMDNATPSGATALAGALTTYAALAGSTQHREAAERALARTGRLLPRHARFSGWAAAIGEALLAGPLEIAVVTRQDPGDDPLTRRAWRGTSPGAVVVAGKPDAVGVPLLAHRGYVDGSPTAYVCREFVCERPMTDPDELALRVGAQLRT